MSWDFSSISLGSKTTALGERITNEKDTPFLTELVGQEFFEEFQLEAVDARQKHTYTHKPVISLSTKNTILGLTS